jgi:hypothetical protein
MTSIQTKFYGVKEVTVYLSKKDLIDLAFTYLTDEQKSFFIEKDFEINEEGFNLGHVSSMREHIKVLFSRKEEVSEKA